MIPLILGITTASVATAVYTLQSKVIFLPKFANVCPIENNPSLLGVPYTEHMIPVPKTNILLHSWFLPAVQCSSTPAPVICFFHGNAGNIASRTISICELYKRFNRNVSILLFDYRGYGKSNGVPSEQGVYDDGMAVIDWLMANEKVDSSRIFLFGRSLGGAVSIYCSKHCPVVKGLIVENSFSSIYDLLPDVLSPNTARLIPKCALRCHFPSSQHIKDVFVPLLIISGSGDELIPSSHSQVLFDSAINSKRKHLARIELGTHNETWRRAGYYEEFCGFVNALINEND
ncbi:hypothetical protein P9112_006602 [Eukaryota sp. TZLM1-RC]